MYQVEIFFLILKKHEIIFFKNILPKNSFFHQEHWITHDVLDAKKILRSTKWIEQDWFLNPTSTNPFKKVNVFVKKYREMVGDYLDPLNKDLWNNYSFKAIKMYNPFYLKWRKMPIDFFYTYKRNVSNFPDKNNNIREFLLHNTKVVNHDKIVKNFVKDCTNFIQEINLNHWQQTNEFSKNFSKNVPAERNIFGDIIDKSFNKINFIDNEILTQFQVNRNEGEDIRLSKTISLNRKGTLVCMEQAFLGVDPYFEKLILNYWKNPKDRLFLKSGRYFINHFQSVFFEDIFNQLKLEKLKFEKLDGKDKFNLTDFIKTYIIENVTLLEEDLKFWKFKNQRNIQKDSNNNPLTNFLEQNIQNLKNLKNNNNIIQPEFVEFIKKYMDTVPDKYHIESFEDVIKIDKKTNLLFDQFLAKHNLEVDVLGTKCGWILRYKKNIKKIFKI